MWKIVLLATVATINTATADFLAPEHLTRSRSYGISKPSSAAQARSDVAADRADRARIARKLTPVETKEPVYERLEGGVLRIPPGGKVPLDYFMLPAEDLTEGCFAVPRDVVSKTKTVTLYRLDGTPLRMMVPVYWDVRRIKYEKGTGAPLFQRPREEIKPVNEAI